MCVCVCSRFPWHLRYQGVARSMGLVISTFEEQGGSCRRPFCFPPFVDCCLVGYVTTNNTWVPVTKKNHTTSKPRSQDVAEHTEDSHKHSSWRKCDNLDRKISAFKEKNSSATWKDILELKILPTYLDDLPWGRMTTIKTEIAGLEEGMQEISPQVLNKYCKEMENRGKNIKKFRGQSHET